MLIYPYQQVYECSLKINHDSVITSICRNRAGNLASMISGMDANQLLEPAHNRQCIPIKTNH